MKMNNYYTNLHSNRIWSCEVFRAGYENMWRLASIWVCGVTLFLSSSIL